MIKAAIEKIEKMSAPNIVQHGDEKLSDKLLHRVIVDKNPAPACLEIQTLTGLVDYIKAGLDQHKSYLVHVDSHLRVVLYGELEPEFGRRKKYVEAKIDDFDFRFNQFYDAETFNIKLQSQFADVRDRDKLLSIVGNVTDEIKTTLEDDGISQHVAVKAGISRQSDVKLPNPVKLAPFRTFPEIDPLESSFVFGSRKGNGIEFALFEADNRQWKLEIVHAIRDYLVVNLDLKVQIIA